MLITLELVRDQWKSCYSRERLAALYDRPHTAREVLTRTDGAWADVSDADRLWTILHEGALELSTLRSFAADCAERAKKHAVRARARAAAARYASRYAAGAAAGARAAGARAAARYAAGAAADAAAAARYAGDDASDAGYAADEREAQMAWLVAELTKE